MIIDWRLTADCLAWLNLALSVWGIGSFIYLLLGLSPWQAGLAAIAGGAILEILGRRVIHRADQERQQWARGRR